MQNISKSQNFFNKAKDLIPGGVNSPVRAFNSVGGVPRFIQKASGPYLYDVDGNRYVDTICSWGPAIVGHANEEVVLAVKNSLSNGLSFGAPTEGETILSEMVKENVDSVEQVRLTSSGTEATMSSIRLARGYTNRDKIVKFEGCYHSHVDSLLVKAGSGLLTFGNPTSGGVPKAFAGETIVLPYNDSQALVECFKAFSDEIAAVIIEPIAGNMNLVKPDKEFVKLLRDTCDKFGSLLIFDEVMTGFRVSLGGAQQILDISPDLSTFGKVIGGGMPMGAFAGKKEVMKHLAPLGPVYQAGTLSGNPIAVAAGIATLKIVSQPNFFRSLEFLTKELIVGLRDIARDREVEEFSSDYVGGMFGIYFRTEIPKTFNDVLDSNIDLFKRFFHEMLKRGVYLAPSPYEAGFLSIKHEGKPVQEILEAAKESFDAINEKKEQ